MSGRIAALLTACFLLAGLAAPAARAEQPEPEQGTLGLGQVTDRFMKDYQSSAEFGYGPSVELITHPVKGVDNDTANDNFIRHMNMYMEGVNAAAYFHFGDGTDAPGRFLTLELEPSGIPTEDAPDDNYFDYWRPVKFYFAEADWCQHSGKYPDDFITSGEPYQALVQRAARITQKYYSVQFCYDSYSGAIVGEHHPEDPLQGGSISDYVEQQTGQPLPPEVAEYYGNQQMGQDGFEAYLRTVTLADGRHLTEEEIQEILNRQTGGQNDGQIHYNNPRDDPDNHRYEFSQETTTFAGYEATVTTGSDRFNGRIRQGVQYTILVDELLPGVQLLADMRWDGPQLGSTYYMDEAEQQEFRSQINDDLAKLEQYLNQLHYLYDVRQGRDEASEPVEDAVEPEGAVKPGSIHVDASDDPTGEQKISVPAVIGAAVAAGAVLIGGRLVMKKKKKKPGTGKNRAPGTKKAPVRARKPEPEPEREQEKEKPKSTYQLRVRKEFGDTLSPGESLTIFARMVEITPDGAERPAPDLSRRIRVSSPAYLLVDREAMAGEFKTACITVPQGEKYPPEAVVVFDFAGVYKVHMHFKIKRMEILFAQDNLTLPACYDRETRLPFVVTGATERTIVTVEMSNDYYRAELEPTENPENYFVRIRELCKEENEPGRCEEARLRISAGDEQYITCQESLPVYRFHMGMQVLLGAVDCFLTREEGRLRPAVTKGSMIIYDWDEEHHQLVRIAPVPTSYSFKTEEARYQEMLDKLGINCLVDPEPMDGRRFIQFQCAKAVLDPPTRFKAQVTITAEYNGKKYTWTDRKLVRSQPLRQFDSNMSGTMAQLDRDKHMTDRLLHIKKEIWDGGDYVHMFALSNFIDLMLDGYDPAYGYDPGQYDKVKDIWGRFKAGTFQGANGTPETVTLADELELFLQAFMDTAKEVDDSLGFAPRLILGVCTLGMSDVVFTGLTVAREMKSYVENGGDSVWGAFYVGASIVAFEVISDKAMDLGMAKAGKLARRYTPNLVKKVDDAVDSATRAISKGKEKVQSFFTSKKGLKTKEVLEQAKLNRSKIEYDTVKDIHEFRKKSKWTDAELEADRIYHQGGVDATQKLNELLAAEDLVKANPTPVNQRLYKKKMLEVQESKAAMRRLAELPNGKAHRAKFNRTLNEAYEKTNRKVRQDLADALNARNGTRLTADDIEIFNATSSSKADLLAGKRITYDQDITWQVKGRADIEIDQKMAQTIQNRRWFEECNGKLPADDAIAARFAAKTDQSVVQAASLENYGSIDDLNRVLKEHNLPLLNPERVGKTVSFKSAEWFNRCDGLMKAAQLEPDRVLREQLMADAMYYRQEGVRQMVKQFKYVDARNLAAMCRGAGSKLSPEMLRQINLCGKLFETGPNCISLTTLEKMLAAKGVTLEMLAEAAGAAMTAIG